MNPGVIKYLKLVSIPLSLFIMYLLVIFIWNILNLPKGDELISITTNYFNNYGLITVFIGALIKDFLLLANIFPEVLLFF